MKGNNIIPNRLTKLTKSDKILMQNSYRMTKCICGHDVSWHWMDMHRKGRCVYHITELDACHCEKYIKDEETKNEMTLKEELEYYGNSNNSIEV
jgi:hypothetical protein